MADTPAPRGFDAWNAVREKYPFHHQQDGIKGATRPEAVSVEAYGDFLRVPIPEIDVVFWGFLTKEAHTRFGEDFPVDQFDVRGQG